MNSYFLLDSDRAVCANARKQMIEENRQEREEDLIIIHVRG